MFETLIGHRWRRVDAVARLDFGEEDIGAAELEVDARNAVRRAAENLRAQHALKPFRHRLRIRRADMDVVPRVVRHGVSLCCSCRPGNRNSIYPAETEKRSSAGNLI